MILEHRKNYFQAAELAELRSLFGEFEYAHNEYQSGKTDLLEALFTRALFTKLRKDVLADAYVCEAWFTTQEAHGWHTDQHSMLFVGQVFNLWIPFALEAPSPNAPSQSYLSYANPRPDTDGSLKATMEVQQALHELGQQRIASGLGYIPNHSEEAATADARGFQIEHLWDVQPGDLLKLDPSIPHRSGALPKKVLALQCVPTEALLDPNGPAHHSVFTSIVGRKAIAAILLQERAKKQP